jgi:hypothetical protein
MARYVKKGREPLGKFCDCGRVAVRRANSAWQCARCLAINVEDFHQVRRAAEKASVLPSANQLMQEWREANA